MNQNQKKDLRNAAPEQLAELLEDLLELNDTEQSEDSDLNRPARDDSPPADRVKHAQK